MTHPNDIIYTPEEAAAATPDLPPPGHARDEVLRERTDNLEQKAEDIFANRGAIDPSVFQADREIQNILTTTDGLEVSNPDPAYMYCWANYSATNGTQVWTRKNWGWQVVGGDMKECSHLRREDGTRRIGDVLLMRVRKDLHLILERKNEAKRLKQQYGVDSDLRNIVANNPKAFRGMESSDDGIDSPHMQRTMARGEANSGARRTALKQVDSMLRAGNVPGLGRGGTR